MFPKWVMNSETNFVPTGTLLRRARFWQYMRLVRGTYAANLVRYWLLRETSGTVARDASNNRGNGTYSGVTFGQAGIGDGHQCPLFATSFVNVYSAAFNTAFPRAAGTIAVWAKVLNAGVWTDGAARNVFRFQIDGGNFLTLAKQAAANTIQASYIANAQPQENIATNTHASTAWQHYVYAWDSVADQFKFYINATLIATNTTIGGALVGNLLSGQAIFGALNIVPNQPWSGYLAHPAIWNVALPAQAIKRLSRY